ncbi:hypothetical protein BC567DRAFT_226518 [Phyllosticta citribraziliensis]
MRSKPQLVLIAFIGIVLFYCLVVVCLFLPFLSFSFLFFWRLRAFCPRTCRTFHFLSHWPTPLFLFFYFRSLTACLPRFP